MANKNKLSGTVFDEYLKWSDAVDALIQGAQFIFKTKGSDWRMGQVLESVNTSSYESIKIKILDEQPESIISLRLSEILEFHVVPTGATKEASVILYG